MIAGGLQFHAAGNRNDDGGRHNDENRVDEHVMMLGPVGQSGDPVLMAILSYLCDGFGTQGLAQLHEIGPNLVVALVIAC